MAYEKLIKLPIEYVLRQIKPKVKGVKRAKKINIGPVSVNCASIRLQTFKKDTVCVSCGIQGEFFWLERNGNPQYHLNLYGLNEYGHEVLMTKDHIIPKSKGGSNGLHNMQTMCTKCNLKKADKLPG
jgi:5-methylcytosine-specific restriction endonuclease McrA